MSPNFWWLKEFWLLFASSIVWVVCLWRSKYAHQLKLKQDLTQDMFQYIFRRTPLPQKIQIQTQKNCLFCHLRCQLIGLTNKNVWPKTAGMHDLIFITDVSWPFENAIDRYVINASFFRSRPNGINWQIPPSGRKETNAFCFYKYSLLTIWLMCHGHFKEEVQRWIYFSFFRNF